MQRRLWDELYERPNRDLFDLYYTNWASRDSLDAALDRYPAEAPRIAGTAETLPRRVAESVRATAALLDRPVPDLDVQLLVGLFSSDGWVRTFRERRTLFLPPSTSRSTTTSSSRTNVPTSSTERRASTARRSAPL